MSARSRPRVELLQRLRIRPISLIRLDVHAIGAVVELEVVDVLRAEKDLHRVVISPSGSPSASARSRDRSSTCICGSLAVNELNSPRSFGDWFPAATTA